jgi:hypothetical protein
MVMALLLITHIANASEPFTQSRTSGPTVLVIAYRCNPEKRAELREQVVKTGLVRFEEWKKQGIVKEYRILWNSYLDSETFDMLALLTFDKYSDVARWKEVERTAPGGLSGDSLKLVTMAVTHSLDLVRQGASPQPSVRGKSVFFVIPYDYLVSTDEYVKYVEGYVVPQFEGWLKENVLASYRAYLSRYNTSRAWGSLIFLEYRDHDAFGLRESTVAKVRKDLQADPAWKALSENKQRVRVEKQTIIAEELVAQ